MRISGSIIALLMVGVLVVPSEASASDAIQRAGDFVTGAVESLRDFFTGIVKGVMDFVGGSRDSDMREENVTGADRFLNARNNSSQRGQKLAAKVTSDAGEGWQGRVSGRGAEDSTQADQYANRGGRMRRNPGLPKKHPVRIIKDGPRYAYAYV